MSTVEEAPAARAVLKPRPEDESRFVLHGISWQFYEAFLSELGYRPRLRLTYDRGSLELMTTSDLHEWYKKILDRLIFFLAMELGMRIRSGGSATFKRRDMLRGLEPDECYWFRNAHLLRGRREVDLTRDPPFELAIEVEMSRSAADRMGIYAALGIAEVWRFDGETLRVCLLQTDTTYTEATESRIFPGVPPEEIVRFANLGLDAEEEISFIESFRSWVRQHILPGWQGPTASP